MLTFNKLNVVLIVSVIVVCIQRCVCDESNSVVVNTSSGGVRGQTLNVVNHKINQFLNIPYAEPPVGPLRFSPPQPLQTPKKVFKKLFS